MERIHLKLLRHAISLLESIEQKLDALVTYRLQSPISEPPIDPPTFLVSDKPEITVSPELLNHWRRDQEENQRFNEKSLRSQQRLFWATIAAFLAALLAAAAATAYTYVSKLQLDAYLKESVLSHPGRLRITNVGVSVNGDRQPISGFKAGMLLEGEVPVINAAREDARIRKSACMVYWHEGNLPVYRPYYPGVPKESSCGELKTDQFGPNGADKWTFSTTVPPSYTERMKLYVSGYILYDDPLSIRRYVLFGRQYDPKKQRFVEVSNPDYEDRDY